MKTMNGFTNELLVKRAKRNWRTRCGAFLLAVLTSWYGGNAMADVILTTGPGNGLANGEVFANTPLGGDLEGQGAPANGNNEGTGTGQEYSWNARNTNGNSLNALASGIVVSTQIGTVYGTHNLSASTANLQFQGSGGSVYFSDSLSWGPNTSFSVAAASEGTIVVHNDNTVLNLGNRLVVNTGGVLNINDRNVGDTGYTSGSVQISGGTNAGTINVNDTEFTMIGELGGAGNIIINRLGMLNVNMNGTISQNITGNHSGSGDAARRGQINVMTEERATITGNLSGSIAFGGGGRITLNSDNTATALSAVYARDNTEVVIRNATNLGGDGASIKGAGLVLANGGGFTKSGEVGDVTIANDIFISGSGMLNSSISGTDASNPIYWNADADRLMDGGRRLTVSGGISSYVDNKIYINSDEARNALGTVVLTHDNSFDGDIEIQKGILEITRQANLGISNNAYDIDRQYVHIGNSTTFAPIRSVLRVVGGYGTSQTITNWIQLNSSESFYEVFTSRDDRLTLADADRFSVVQAGVIEGYGNLNKSGDGVLILNTTNNYEGDTIIWHGVLRIDNQDAINNDATAQLKIGGLTSYEEANFRPVFETVLPTGVTQGTMSINARVMLNQTNSTIRITGENNVTRFTGGIYSDYTNVGVDKAAVLNKDGAGTMVLDSNGAWGDGTKGETNILQGTLEFSRAAYLANGTITIGTNWHTYKDIDESVVYKAILKLSDGATAGINNHIVLNSPIPTNLDDSASGSYIEVGTGSVLSVAGNISSTAGFSSNLNKIGSGKLILQGSSNTYGGWANVYEGTLATSSAYNLRNTAGVNLIGGGTTFDMSEPGADQEIQGLKGIDSANADDPSSWTRRVLIGDNTLTLLQTENLATLHGAVLGTGTFVKSGIANSEFRTGFELGSEKFTGSVSVQTGTLAALTDVTLTGITGKVGTFFDVRDNTLTLDINESMQYSGTIISSYPSLPFDKNTDRSEIIKTGLGTLKAGFSDKNAGSGVIKGFFGDLTIKEGSIISTSDYYMEGGGKLTFGVSTDVTGAIVPNTLDVSAHNAYFRQGGANGTQYSTVHVTLDDTSTGWSTPAGSVTVARILGGDKSDYSGLVASDIDSLFYSLKLEDDRGTNSYNKLLKLDVTGFGGVGNTYNTRAVGTNLDKVRTADLSGNTELRDLIKYLWCVGSNLDKDKWDLAANGINDMLQQMSADTIANAMFMGLDKPWQAAFHRLNLDSQMVYVGPQGGAIANMRNLWFTPTVQTLSARGDGNARKFGIDRPGYKIGFDKRVAQNTSVGFQLGYSSPKMHQGDDRVTASDFQFGLYGGSMVGNYVEMKGFIGFGHQNYKSTRSVYNRIGDWTTCPMPSKDYVAHGRYDGDTFNFSFEVSRPLFLGFTIVRPTIGLDSEHAFRYAFTESGGAIAMKFQRSSLSRTRARFGLSFETTTLDRAIFTGRLGYSCLLGGHDYAEAKGQFINVYEADQTTRSVAVGKSYFEAGVGTRIFLNPVKTLSLVGNYDATVGNRWAEHQALVGFAYIY